MEYIYETLGNIEPHRTQLEPEMLYDGVLRFGYYHSEVEAWDGIHAYWRERVAEEEACEANTYEDYLRAKMELSCVRAKQQLAGEAYEQWRSNPYCKQSNVEAVAFPIEMRSVSE